ncbi:hypothetical protein L484_002216 [Morus notabilis]|uniref:Uncharacterized protein n=1 Tax=Morus notabilis TaxID=981085 RepID=W9QM91_9ROSA|nr:hypothetical protein L484_002216 [Morus notabilis]
MHSWFIQRTGSEAEIPVECRALKVLHLHDSLQESAYEPLSPKAESRQEVLEMCRQSAVDDCAKWQTCASVFSSLEEFWLMVVKVL